MKFCYLDETGTGQDTVVIVVGVVVDVQRMNRTKQEWQSLFDQISKLAHKPIKEIHAKDLIPGNNEWRGVNGDDRANVVTTILEWLVNRNHKVTFSAIDKAKFSASQDERKVSFKNEWYAAAFHVALTLQKAHQGKDKNKGHTLLIFDKGKDPQQIISLLTAPPVWSHTYYGKGKKQEPLDQIVDVPFFADSQYVPLIQIADLVGYILRRYADLVDYGQSGYPGELERYQKWIETIQSTCFETNMRYKKRGACDTSNFFRELAPPSLRDL